jgi:single-stranded-DNA-specific exonuclease
MRWTLKKNSEKEKIIQLATDLSVDKTIAKILLNREISSFDEAKKFFRPSLSDLHNPFLMKDMDIAIQRIETAITNNENILVFGDYDVDGTTSVSLVSSYLKTYYPNVAT